MESAVTLDTARVYVTHCVEVVTGVVSSFIHFIQSFEGGHEYSTVYYVVVHLHIFTPQIP